MKVSSEIKIPREFLGQNHSFNNMCESFGLSQSMHDWVSLFRSEWLQAKYRLFSDYLVTNSSLISITTSVNDPKNAWQR